MDAQATRVGQQWRGVPLLPQPGTLSVLELGLLVLAAACILLLNSQNLLDVLIQTFLWAGVALAWNIAGGYARDIEDSVEIHANTLQAARRIYG